MSFTPLVLVPARMASTRLPGKPLADIHGKPMIVHVLDRAAEADVGPVALACCEPEVFEAAKDAGYEAVMTDPDLPSGSDRIWQALCRLDPTEKYSAVINVQGDLPTLQPGLLPSALKALETGADIATLVTEISDESEKTNPHVVKCALGLGPQQTIGRALYFSRTTMPYGDGPLYHHIGLYAYTRQALARFVKLPPGVLEQREKLEQLRALENGMWIAAACVDTPPLGVDTPADLEKARSVLGSL